VGGHYRHWTEKKGKKEKASVVHLGDEGAPRRHDDEAGLRHRGVAAIVSGRKKKGGHLYRGGKDTSAFWGKNGDATKREKKERTSKERQKSYQRGGGGDLGHVLIEWWGMQFGRRSAPRAKGWEGKKAMCRGSPLQRKGKKTAEEPRLAEKEADRYSRRGGGRRDRAEPKPRWLHGRGAKKELRLLK